jgi:hypothetical protein
MVFAAAIKPGAPEIAPTGDRGRIAGPGERPGMASLAGV